MRQVAAAAVVAAVVAMSALAHAGEAGNNTTKLSPTGSCTFNSRLPLKVYVVREAGGFEEEIGRTPSAKPVVIPRCASWFVDTAGPLDTRALAKEIASKGLPGLRLSWRGTDGHLAHLKDLTGLRKLGLRATKTTDAGLKITDAGLAHLEGLTALRELDPGRREDH